MNPEKLAKMAAQVRTGGKGSVRRKKKAIHKTTTTDDKRLQNTLKRLGVNNVCQMPEFCHRGHWPSLSYPCRWLPLPIFAPDSCD